MSDEDPRALRRARLVRLSWWLLFLMPQAFLGAFYSSKIAHDASDRRMSELWNYAGVACLVAGFGAEIAFLWIHFYGKNPR